MRTALFSWPRLRLHAAHIDLYCLDDMGENVNFSPSTDRARPTDNCIDDIAAFLMISRSVLDRTIYHTKLQATYLIRALVLLDTR